MGSTVKKVMRPEVLLPLAVIGTGGAALGAFGPAAKAAMVGTGGIAPVAGLPAVGEEQLQQQQEQKELLVFLVDCLERVVKCQLQLN